MTDTPNRPPLWRQMQRAADAAMATYHPSATDEQLLAAEIRAVAEWLVPEEEPLPDSLYGGNHFARQSERQRLRALLTTEADRAERGDHG